jgi:nucleotidyltransferase/DNA polymerase involved in DNA repair
MLAHIYIPDFIATVQARSQGLVGEPVAVCDKSRIISVNEPARKLGLKSDLLLEKQEIPPKINQLEFDLKPLTREQEELRKGVQDLTPLLEILNLGEVLAEVEETDAVKGWLDKQNDENFNLMASVAPTGWLARIISHRRTDDFTIIDENYRESLMEVKIEEVWGLGHEFKDKMRQLGIEKMSEVYELSEMERRKQIGKKSRFLHQILNRVDPRPLSVFSRPRSLSREISPSPEGSENKDRIRDILDPVLKRFQTRLRASVSCSHRLRLAVSFENNSRIMRSHVFPRPVDEEKVLKFALRQMLRDITLSKAVKSVVVEVDVIVADLENYHLKAQRGATDFEIIDNPD